MLGFGSALLVLSSGVTWLWLKEKKPPFFSNFSLKITALVLSAVVLAALFFGTPFSPSISDFLSRTTNPDGDLAASNQVPQPLNRLEVGGTDSGEIRRIVWQGAFDVWRRYPVFGSGVETFAYSYYLDRPTAHNLVSEWDFLYNKAHNEFLNFLATTGVVGAGTYVAMLGMMGWVGVRVAMSARSAPADRALSLGLLAGIAALSTTNFFGFSTVTVSVLLFLFAAWLVILASDQDTVLKQAAQTPVKSTSQRNSLAWWQKAGLLATSLVTLFFLNQVHTYWQADRLFAEGKKYIGAGYLAHGLQLLTTAVQRSPAEAVFYNELGEAYAQAALTEVQSGNASTAAQLAEASAINHTTAINLNAHHLNFYKAYTQSLIRMSPLEPKLLEEARFVLEKARTLAPTDPRLSYNLHLVEDSLGNSEKSLEYLQETIELKPNYASARVRLGKYFLEQQEYASASAEFSYILTYIAPDDASVQTLLEQAQASSSAESAKK
jgi:tetratricopeptide (TPR) repeat protein